MTKEHTALTISELIGKVASLGVCEGYRTNLEYIDGKLSFTAEPMVQPFTVKDDGVHMEPAKVDYEALGRDVASASSEKAENLKVDVDAIKVEGALTPDDVAQAYLETIGDAVGPSSDIVISIGTLNVNVS